MKFLFIPVFILSLFTSEVFAKKKLPFYGYYITNEGDTIECKLYIPFYEKNSGERTVDLHRIQSGLKARNLDNEKIRVKPNKMSGFCFAYAYNQYNFQSVRNNLNFSGRKIFLHRTIDGKMKMYTFYRDFSIYTPEIDLSLRYDAYCIQKGEGKVELLTIDFYETTLKDYISDCNKVLYKYGTEEYNYEHIIRIIMDYNECGK